MTEEQLQEAEKSWRISIHFAFWVFIVYGNWKRRVIRVNFGFKVYDFHPINPKKSWEEREKLK